MLDVVGSNKFIAGYNDESVLGDSSYICIYGMLFNKHPNPRYRKAGDVFSAMCYSFCNIKICVSVC